MSEIRGEQVDLPGPDKGKFAVVIRNVLSESECQELIARTEAAGYVDAMVNIGGGREMLMTDYRHSKRCIIDDVSYAAELKSRIEDFLPKTKAGRSLVSLNERLRFLRYTSGDFFAPHCDGSYIRENGEKSLITLMLYLNGGIAGGTTRFINVCISSAVLITKYLY